MCGLLALYGETRPAPSVLDAALALQRHRGPDGTRTARFPNAWLGFNRLAIIDPTPASDQPMRHGPITAVLNGEIYNYIELREQLRGQGADFVSDGDAEVLAAAIHVLGPERAFAAARGMWACVAYDERDGAMIVSRDRFGIKPLWWTQYGSTVAFASEIKSLVSLADEPGRIDVSTLARYLVFGDLDRSDQTFVEGVHAFPKGCYARLTSRSGLVPLRYWDPENSMAGRRNSDPAELKAVLEDTIRLHLRSDVPVSVTLSGGLDSTVIAGFARAQGVLRCYSVVPPDAADESSEINQTVALWGLDHRYVETKGVESAAVIDSILGTLDQPFKAAQSIYQYAIRQAAARDGIRVLLTGDGADEIFSGYRNCVQPYLNGLVHEGRLLRAAMDAARLAPFARIGARSLFVSSSRRKVAAFLGDRQAACTVEFQNYVSPEIVRAATGVPYAKSALSLKSHLAERLFVEGIPYWLRIDDGLSMAHSIENRVPYLDHVLYEHAMGHAESEFMAGGRNKAMLRKAVAGFLPRHILDPLIKRQRPGSSRRLIFQVLSEAATDVFADKDATRAILGDGVGADEFRRDQAQRRNSAFWLRAYLACRWRAICLGRQTGVRERMHG